MIDKIQRIQKSFINSLKTVNSFILPDFSKTFKDLKTMWEGIQNIFK